MLQPWIAKDEGQPAQSMPDRVGMENGSALQQHFGELLDLVGEAALVGRRRVPGRLWQDLRAQSRALGLIHIPNSIEPESALALSALVVYSLADPEFPGLVG